METELEKYKEIMLGWKDLYEKQQRLHQEDLEQIKHWANLLELGLKSTHEGLEFAVTSVLSQIKRRTQ